MLNMRKLLVIACFSLLVETGAAQAPNRYEPARRTVSPYLNLGGRRASTVPNYFSLVRPSLQLDAQLRSAAAGGRGGALSAPIQLTSPAAPGASGLMVGRQSGFLTFSHFYPPHPTYGRASRGRPIR